MNNLNRLKKLLNLYTLMGLLFLLIGIIGIFLPLLPTTPFLLLASYFFSKGNPEFRDWLVNHKIFGPPIRDWNKRGAIRLKYKILASSMIAFSAVYIHFFSRIPFIGLVGSSIVFFFVLGFIWSRPGH